MKPFPWRFVNFWLLLYAVTWEWKREWYRFLDTTGKAAFFLKVHCATFHLGLHNLSKKKIVVIILFGAISIWHKNILIKLQKKLKCCKHITTLLNIALIVKYLAGFISFKKIKLKASVFFLIFSISEKYLKNEQHQCLCCEWVTFPKIWHATLLRAVRVSTDTGSCVWI